MTTPTPRTGNRSGSGAQVDGSQVVVNQVVPDPSAPVPLEVLEQLARQHHEHEKYYALAPLRDAETVLRAARTLKALAGRWEQVRVRAPESPINPYLACDDLNDSVAVETHGILFLESGGQPAELLDLKEQLRHLAESAEQMGAWLRAAMDTSWETAGRTLGHPGLAGLQGDRHRIIANDMLVAAETWHSGLLIHRAVELLEAVDLSTVGVRHDLRSGRTAPGYLRSAATLLDRAADLCLASTALTRDSEPRWRTWQAQLQHLMAGPPPAPTQRAAAIADTTASAEERESHRS